MRRSLALILALALSFTVGVASVAAHAFPQRIDLPDGFQPEGITTGCGTTLYAGSLADGAIWRGDARTGEGEVFIEGEPGNVAVGVDYERSADRLWVAGGPTGEVRVYDAKSGALLETYEVDAGFLNDLVVTREAVYVTDSMIQQLIVIPLGPGGALPDDATTLDLTGDLEYIEGFNANGIVEARNYLILVQSNTGILFRVDPDTGETVAIDTDGYSVSGGDGLELRGSTLYVVRNELNLIAVLRLGEHLTSARLVDELTSPDFSVPTTVTLAAGRLWAVNARFGTPPTPETEYWITQVDPR